MEFNIKHTKEFNAEHAQAGAPYCQRNGLAARIGIWDKLNSHCLSGVMQDSTLTPTEIDSSWNIKGQWLEGEISNCDLVMLPLGMCEGKPVFVGDELIFDSRKYCVSLEYWFDLRECQRHFIDSTWPRTAPVMPKSELWLRSSDQSYTTPDEALAHAIDCQRKEIEAYWKALDEFNGVKK